MKKRRNSNKSVKSFYVGFSTWLVTCTGLFILNGLTYHGNWWAIWPFFGWGIAVLVQGVTTFQGVFLSTNTGEMNRRTIGANEQFLDFEQVKDQVEDTSVLRKSIYNEKDFV
ncbi:MAG: 2TM domain-containing protein [Saprospiraceae bacterium]